MPPSLPHEPSNGRRVPRDRAPRVLCNLGELADLSPTGARIRTRRKPRVHPGDILEISIGAPPAPPPRRARVFWVRRTGFFRYEMGVEFEAPEPARSLPFPAPSPARRSA